MTSRLDPVCIWACDRPNRTTLALPRCCLADQTTTEFVQSTSVCRDEAIAAHRPVSRNSAILVPAASIAFFRRMTGRGQAAHSLHFETSHCLTLSSMMTQSSSWRSDPSDRSSPTGPNNRRHLHASRVMATQLPCKSQSKRRPNPAGDEPQVKHPQSVGMLSGCSWATSNWNDLFPPFLALCTKAIYHDLREP